MKVEVEKKISVQSKTFESKLNSVVSEKRDEIFDTVRNMIPKEEVEFFNMMKSFVPRM